MLGCASLPRPQVFSDSPPLNLLAQKVLRQGYYWPTMWEYTKNMVRSCDKYQKFTRVLHLPLEKLTVITSPWPFAI